MKRCIPLIHWSIICTSLWCALVAREVCANDFVPLQTTSGEIFRSELNDLLGGVAASEPQLACKNEPDLPSVVTKGKLLYCHGCAVTNPCTVGESDLLALGVCSDGSATCTGFQASWNCNQGIVALKQPYTVPLASNITMSTDGTRMTLTPFTTRWSLGVSPTTRFYNTLDVVLLVELSDLHGPPDACSFQLLVNGIVQRVATVWNTGGGPTSTISEVSLHWEGTTTSNQVEFDWQVVGQTTVGDTCVVHATMLGLVGGGVFQLGPASKLTFTSVFN